MFSARVPTSLTSNRIARTVARARAQGADLADLTESNPTRVGLSYPDGVLDPLASPTALDYRPAPLGLPAARSAVADYLRHHDLDVKSDQVVLTSSTSEAYAALFKLLCDPGDQVLVPRPSYPLFDHLTRLEGVEAVPYALEYHGRWEIDVADLRSRLTPRARAMLLVNPNNPTGSFVSVEEHDALDGVARAHDLAIVVDEVFGFYSMRDPVRGPSVHDRTSGTLTVGLGGFSKAIGLPQLKLGWLILDGPASLVERARERLELILDTTLALATPVQLAAQAILEVGSSVTSQIRQRIRRNYAVLREQLAGYPAARLLPVDGGWYAPVQVPALRSEEALVIELIERDGVLVHPGYFYDFPREAFLVLSLLPEPRRFDAALARVLHAATHEPGRVTR